MCVKGKHEIYCCGARVRISENGIEVLGKPLVEYCPLHEALYGTKHIVSGIFSKIVSKLGLDDGSRGLGKPKSIRMHGLRNYFRNNIKADSAYIKFWMGHSLGVDAHYISRNLEKHRTMYKEGYGRLRVYTVAEANEMKEIVEQQAQEIARLKKTVRRLTLTEKQMTIVEKLLEKVDKGEIKL